MGGIMIYVRKKIFLHPQNLYFYNFNIVFFKKITPNLQSE